MKAQASIEFLSTYGWAFIIIILMIGTVSYFGVTNPDVFVAEKCTFEEDITCVDFFASSITLKNEDDVGLLVLTMRQSTGRSVFVQDMDCSRQYESFAYIHQEGEEFSERNNMLDDVAAIDLDDPLRQWDPSEEFTIKCHISDSGNSPFIKGESASVPVSLAIKKRADGFTHVYNSEVITRVQ